MILTTHLVAGAVIATKINNPVLGLFLAFLSHYFLDFICHREYNINNIIEKQWKKSRFDFLKVFLDISLGVLLILFFSKNLSIALLGGFFSILADGFTILNLIFSNKLLQTHNNFHQKIHFLKYKKIPFGGRILTQLLITLTAIFLLMQ